MFFLYTWEYRQSFGEPITFSFNVDTPANYSCCLLYFKNFYDIVRYINRKVCQFDDLSNMTLENSNFIKIQCLGSTQSLFSGKQDSFSEGKLGVP